MEHTQIVTPADLERYADRQGVSAAVLPALVYELVRESVPDLSECRIPRGDAINQPGADGLVVRGATPHQFVPAGESYWEMGIEKKPTNKATEEFRKRTKSLSAEERNRMTFVFVTPRSSGQGGWHEPSQRKWRTARTHQGWRAISILDGVKLADWLREFPAIGRWLQTKVGDARSQTGFTTPREYWEELQFSTREGGTLLPANVFLAGREAACLALKKLFEGQSEKLLLAAESQNDVADFVAAYLASLDDETGRLYGNRCLFVDGEDAWHSLVSPKPSHVLVAHPRLELESADCRLCTMALKRGHKVVIPICGAVVGEKPEIIRLRSPSQSVLVEALRVAGYSYHRSGELAAIGANRLATLKRELMGLGAVPPYATWENASILAKAGLAGKWEGNNAADQTSMEIMLGKSYGEWIATARPETLRADTPLIQRNERWKILARSEAWDALGPHLSDDDLGRFQKMALQVLAELDPRFDLPKEERFAAGSENKLRHSESLREGIAETLALLGSRPEALVSCSEGRARLTAVLTVRGLLEKADWQMWASLHSLHPLLAEAAPEEFLAAVEGTLEDPAESPFHQVFAQESNGAFGGWNYISGLLWALESLAWNSDYLARVTLVLGELAAIDPGGNWSNRPANSLVEIYLPWHLQTCALPETRASAVRSLLHEQPEMGWNLILALLPNNHGCASGTHRPSWQKFIPPHWKETVPKKEYWDQIEACAKLAADVAAVSTAKLAALIERLPDLSYKARESLLSHLESDAVMNLPESERLSVWNALVDLARHHRKFSDAEWAMPSPEIEKIEATAGKLAPAQLSLRHQRLFNGNDGDHYDTLGSYEEQREKLKMVRQEAVRAIFTSGGTSAVVDFAGKVSTPGQVGVTFGGIAPDEVDAELLPGGLEKDDAAGSSFIGGFVLGRFWTQSWPWVDAVLRVSSDPPQKADFLVLLPFEEGAWKRAASQLGDFEGHYWKHVRVDPWGPGKDLAKAAEKLLHYQRPKAALHCVAWLAEHHSPLDPDLAESALLQTPTVDEAFNYNDARAAIQVINWLQECPETIVGKLFQIEWAFLPLLDRFSGGSPKTLERRLASDPAFYCEVIGMAFRSSKNKEIKKEPSEEERAMAKSAYRLLYNWKTIPGQRTDGSFDASAFSAWLAETRRLSAESGHFKIALSQLGESLAKALPQGENLWIHESVAEALNARDAGAMRSGFTCGLFNRRGTHGFTTGREERELARLQRERADASEANGFARFAGAMREFASQYDRDADREAERDPFYE